MKRSCAFSSPAALAVVLVAAGAAAQSPAEISAARGVGIEGVRLADAGNCTEAVPKLERAERIFHAPTTLGRLGECQVQLGMLVAGTEALQRVVREPLAPGAPNAFLMAKSRAQRVLDAALPKLARLKITVSAPADAKVTVTLDGEAVPASLIDVDRPTDPGAHKVEASAEGYKRASAGVALREGGSESVTLTLEPDPSARPPESPPVAAAPPAAPPAAAAAPPPAGPPPAAEAPSRALPYTLLGVGAAGVVVGSIFGIIALNKESSLHDACPNKVCPASQNDAISSASNAGTVSTVGFAVGAAGLIAGGVILVARPAPARSTGLRVQPAVGLGSISLKGSF